MRATSLLLAGLATFGCTGGPAAQTPAVTHPIPKQYELKFPLSKIAETMTYCMKSSSLTTKAGEKDGCCLRLQVGPFGGSPFEFTLPDRKIDLGYAGAIVYRLNSLRMKSCAVSEKDGQLIVLADLVSDGPTLKGLHSALGDGAVPDVNLKNMQLTVRLRPALTKEGKPTYDDPRTTFKADVSSSLGELQFGSTRIDVLDTVSGYRERIRSGIESEVSKAIQSETVKSAIERQLWSALQKFAAAFSSKVTKVTMSGSSLVLSLERDDSYGPIEK